MEIKVERNCIHFKDYTPCWPNKKYNRQCRCEFYTPILKKILIIKLGAIGDVIRTTPIITRLSKLYPNSKIYWVTDFPEILPKEVHYKFKPDFKSIEILKSIDFDLLFNLDKDLEACSLATYISSSIKKGFCLQEGRVIPIDEDAKHKYLTGVFDEVSKKNKKHYVEEIFEICGIGRFNNEKYLLNKSEIIKIGYDKKVIGLNTGCSPRWNTRLWPVDYWISLSKELIDKNYKVILLGGEIENKKNLEISSESGANYFGYSNINKFIERINSCDLIVTQVTSALHIAIALEKRIVLMNNIFNKNEFYLYNLGEIIEPETGCDCFYSSKCERDRHCMKDISVDSILEAVERNLW